MVIKSGQNKYSTPFGAINPIEYDNLKVKSLQADDITSNTVLSVTQTISQITGNLDMGTNNITNAGTIICDTIQATTFDAQIVDEINVKDSKFILDSDGPNPVTLEATSNTLKIDKDIYVNSNKVLTDTTVTTDIPEGTNLYYTDTRVSANTDVAANTTHRGLTNNTHGVTGNIVGTTDTQTLTNKTIDYNTNTITNIPAPDLSPYFNKDNTGIEVVKGKPIIEQGLYIGDGATPNLQTLEWRDGVNDNAIIQQIGNGDLYLNKNLHTDGDILFNGTIPVRDFLYDIVEGTPGLEIWGEYNDGFYNTPLTTPVNYFITDMCGAVPNCVKKNASLDGTYTGTNRALSIRVDNLANGEHVSNGADQFYFELSVSEATTTVNSTYVSFGIFTDDFIHNNSVAYFNQASPVFECLWKPFDVSAGKIHWISTDLGLSPNRELPASDQPPNTTQYLERMSLLIDFQNNQIKLYREGTLFKTINQTNSGNWALLKGGKPFRFYVAHAITSASTTIYVYKDSDMLHKATIAPTANTWGDSYGGVGGFSSTTNIYTKTETNNLLTNMVELDEVQVLTNKTFNVDDNTLQNVSNGNIKVGANIDSLKIGTGLISTTEFNYLDNVSSNIQTQLNSKITASSTDTLTNKTISTANNTLTIALNDLSDVDLTTPPTTNQVLKWSGSAFIPQNDATLNDADYVKISGTQQITGLKSFLQDIEGLKDVYVNKNGSSGTGNLILTNGDSENIRLQTSTGSNSLIISDHTLTIMAEFTPTHNILYNPLRLYNDLRLMSSHNVVCDGTEMKLFTSSTTENIKMNSVGTYIKKINTLAGEDVIFNSNSDISSTSSTFTIRNTANPSLTISTALIGTTGDLNIPNTKSYKINSINALTKNANDIQICDTTGTPKMIITNTQTFSDNEFYAGTSKHLYTNDDNLDALLNVNNTLVSSRYFVNLFHLKVNSNLAITPATIHQYTLPARFATAGFWIENVKLFRKYIFAPGPKNYYKEITSLSNVDGNENTVADDKNWSYTLYSSTPDTSNYTLDSFRPVFGSKPNWNISSSDYYFIVQMRRDIVNTNLTITPIII